MSPVAQEGKVLSDLPVFTKTIDEMQSSWVSRQRSLLPAVWGWQFLLVGQADPSIVTGPKNFSWRARLFTKQFQATSRHDDDDDDGDDDDGNDSDGDDREDDDGINDSDGDDREDGDVMMDGDG